MKKIFLFLFIPFIMVFGADTQDYYGFVVDNPTMIDAYFNIFNAMAGMFNSTAYNNLLKLVFLMGGFIVFFTGVLKTYETSSGQLAISDFIKYMLVGTALLIFIHSNKKSLVLTTKTFPTYCSAGTGYKQSGITTDTIINGMANTTTGVVVSNIPEVLAWGFAFINEIGTESTKLAKTAFGDINGNVITESPSDFASYLTAVGDIMKTDLSVIASQSNSTAKDMTLGSALQVILNDCILIPAGADSTNGLAIRNTMFSTGDMVRTIDNLIKNATLIKYTNPTEASASSTTVANAVTVNGVQPGDFMVNYNGELTYCSTVWSDVYSRLDALKNSDAIECGPTLRNVLNERTMKVLTGSNAISTTQAKEIALNAGIINLVYNSNKNLMASEMAYASGKSMAQFVNESMGTGYYMAQMLPYLQMGMRAVLYAFFPFVFVVVLLPGGLKVLISYLQSLIWIELWSPTAAILDMFMELVAGTKFQDMYNSQGANMLNGIQTFSDTAMLASIGGYLYASVPALTWLILKGSGYMLGNISGAVAARMASNLNSDSINKDVSDLKRRDLVNQNMREKGKEAVSLAEQERIGSEIQSRHSAGEWVRNVKEMDKQMKAGEGSVANNLSAGLGVYNAITNAEKKGDKDAVGTMSKTTELDKTTDIETTNKLGIKDEKRMNEVANVNSNEKTIDTMTNEKKQAFLKDTFGIKNDKDYNKTVANIQGLEEGEKRIIQNYWQNVQKNLHNGLSVEKSLALAAQTTAVKNGLENSKNDEMFKKLGIKKEDGSYDTKRLAEVGNVLGTTDAIGTKVEEKTQNEVSMNEQVDSKTYTNLETLGKGSAIPRNQKTQLETLKKDDPELYNEINKKLEGLSEDQQVKVLAGELSNVGKKGEIYNANKGDKVAEHSISQGLTSENAAKIDVSKTSNQVFAQSHETYKYLEKEMNSVKEGEIDPNTGKPVFTDSAKTIQKFSEDFHQKTHGAYAQMEDDKKTFKRDENGNIMTKTDNVSQAIYAQGMSATLKANPEAYNTLSSNVKTKVMENNNISAEREGKSAGYASSVNTFVNENWEKLTANSPDLKAYKDTATEILRDVTMSRKLIKEVFSSKNHAISDKNAQRLEVLARSEKAEDMTEAMGIILDTIKTKK